MLEQYKIKEQTTFLHLYISIYNIMYMHVT